MSSGKGQTKNTAEDDEYEEESGFIGFQFADMKEENKKLITLGKYDPNRSHMVVSAGLNFEGKCPNSSQNCKVSKQIVWVQRGFGTFDIGYELDQLNCPICSKALDPASVKSLGYLTAKVKCEGKRKGEAEKFQWQDQQVDGKLVKFEGYDGNSCEWMYLRLTVDRL